MGDPSCDPEITRRTGLGCASVVKKKNTRSTDPNTYHGMYLDSFIWSYRPPHTPLRLQELDHHPGHPHQTQSLQQHAVQEGGPTTRQCGTYVQEHCITSSELLKRVGVQTIVQYIARGHLSWFGYVVRMGHPRARRQLLMAELTNCNRCPFLTHGGSIRSTCVICIPYTTRLLHQPSPWCCCLHEPGPRRLPQKRAARREAKPTSRPPNTPTPHQCPHRR
jgi:hypothetical protein